METCLQQTLLSALSTEYDLTWATSLSNPLSTPHPFILPTAHVLPDSEPVYSNIIVNPAFQFPTYTSRDGHQLYNPGSPVPQLVEPPPSPLMPPLSGYDIEGVTMDTMPPDVDPIPHVNWGALVSFSEQADEVVEVIATQFA